MSYTATYSPEDNKLRLYASTRLPREVYDRMKAAGFKWAPKQELFVAPAWTPEREDLLLELAGEIGDEDTSLVDRAEERAERFEDYHEKRAAEADRAHTAVSAIADAIPLGQPILVGHHSEKRARRDAEKIENGIRKAVRLWRTAQYWTDRAAGALSHAKYKELPAVRARRIKGLEADLRKRTKERDSVAKLLRFWSQPVEQIAPEMALKIANYFDHFTITLPDGSKEWSLWSALKDGKVSVEYAAENRRKTLPPHVERAERWMEHLNNRLAYERAMMAESGGIATDRTGPEKGGACQCWSSPGHGRGWSFIQKVNKVSVTILDNWGNGGKNFTRTIPFDKLKAMMTRAQVEEKRAASLLDEVPSGIGFYLRDTPLPKAKPAREVDPQAEKFEALAESLRAGIKTVTAPQLFPTPPDLAARLVDLADIRPGMRVLEPSSGTGNLIEAMPDTTIVAVEINHALAKALRRRFTGVVVHCSDFLTLDNELGQFDRIVMNPPFERGADIDHIRHAFAKLKPGGRLVAICANGPRQREDLGEICSAWIDLPAGSFKEQGTSVNAAIVVLEG